MSRGRLLLVLTVLGVARPTPRSTSTRTTASRRRDRTPAGPTRSRTSTSARFRPGRSGSLCFRVRRGRHLRDRFAAPRPDRATGVCRRAHHRRPLHARRPGRAGPGRHPVPRRLARLPLAAGLRRALQLQPLLRGAWWWLYLSGLNRRVLPNYFAKLEEDDRAGKKTTRIGVSQPDAALRRSHAGSLPSGALEESRVRATARRAGRG